MSKQFYFKQVSFAYKTVPFQTIQFSINTQLFLFDLLDWTLFGATTPVRVDQGAMAMKGYSAFPYVPALLKPHLQIV